MAENSRGGLFRPRNVLGAALIAGIGLGVYLGPLFKGWGLGGGKTLGISGQDAETHASLGTESKKKEDSMDDALPANVPNVVKVLIDDRSYFLRQSSGDTPIQLPQLIKLVKLAPGDPEGLKIRIYLKTTARASVEEALKAALLDAEIPDTAVFWVPTPVK